MNNLSAFPPGSSIKLLCLSNGHGEDVIAVRILQELQQLTSIDIAALPIVGEGHAYSQSSIPIIGAVQTMPSGGFIYMDGRQVLRDLRYGLLKLTLSQIKVVRSWAKGGVILAVGDIVPLLFAWGSGANYAFVGTAKSEYYRQYELGWHPRRSPLSRLENLSASVYHPFDRYLMSHPRCKAVFPRDTLTTKTLQKWAIPAFDLGNPMMDGLEAQNLFKLDTDPQRLTILLLPGSRPPEAYANWQKMLVAVTELIATFPRRSLLFLAAIAPTLTLEPLIQSLINSGFSQNSLTFKHKNASIILTQNAYNDCLHQADLAIAMAGTATEQFIGLGKCAIAFPGNGPQYTYAFAEAQSRHLGASLTLVEHPKQVADTVRSLLQDPQKLEQIAKNGHQRMGEPGAAHRIAQCLIQQFGWLP